jgi:hypothetical protein
MCSPSSLAEVIILSGTKLYTLSHISECDEAKSLDDNPVRRNYRLKNTLDFVDRRYLDIPGIGLILDSYGVQYEIGVEYGLPSTLTLKNGWHFEKIENREFLVNFELSLRIKNLGASTEESKLIYRPSNTQEITDSVMRVYPQYMSAWLTLLEYCDMEFSEISFEGTQLEVIEEHDLVPLLMFISRQLHDEIFEKNIRGFLVDRVLRL